MASPADALAALRRPSGAFAMVALDQRESLRAMLREARGSAGDDEEVVTFKIAAARALTPEASAVLLDLETGLTPVRDAAAIAPGCALIVAADALTQERGGPVDDTAVDEATFDDPRAADADAFKLLVIWRPDRGAAERAAVVRRFLERCRERGRPGLVEGVVRRPVDAGDAWDHAAAVVACAEELGAFGPDIYKAEVPTLGAGTDVEIDRRVEADQRRPGLSLGGAFERHAAGAVRRRGGRGLSGRGVGVPGRAGALERVPRPRGPDGGPRGGRPAAAPDARGARRRGRRRHRRGRCTPACDIHPHRRVARAGVRGARRRAPARDGGRARGRRRAAGRGDRRWTGPRDDRRASRAAGRRGEARRLGPRRRDLLARWARRSTRSSNGPAGR